MCLQARGGSPRWSVSVQLFLLSSCKVVCAFAFKVEYRSIGPALWCYLVIFACAHRGATISRSLYQPFSSSPPQCSRHRACLLPQVIWTPVTMATVEAAGRLQLAEVERGHLAIVRLLVWTPNCSRWAVEPLCEWVNAASAVKLFELSANWSYRNVRLSVRPLAGVSDWYTEKLGVKSPSRLCRMHCSVLEGAKQQIFGIRLNNRLIQTTVCTQAKRSVWV